jgi:hypothetical protein
LEGLNTDKKIIFFLKIPIKKKKKIPSQGVQMNPWDVCGAATHNHHLHKEEKKKKNFEQQQNANAHHLKNK